jgi:hypothetical protein
MPETLPVLRRPLCLLGALSLLVGCASVPPNARALRMYQREEPSVALLRQHLQELADTLTLINVLLNDTPYTPGDAWIAALPLDDAKAVRARALLNDTAERSSFVQVYSTHVRSLLPRAENTLASTSPGPTAPASAQYVSLAAALAGVDTNLVPNLGALEQRLTSQVDELNRRQAELEATGQPDPREIARIQADRERQASQLSALRANLGRAPATADLRDPLKAQIVRDATTATSIALRLVSEAIALATVAGLEAAALARRPPGGWLNSALETAELVAELPDDARRVHHELEQLASGLRPILNRLAAFEHVDVFETAGFHYREGLLDEIVGFGWDSVHLELQAGGEALFYSPLADKEQMSSGDDTYDYSGRFTKLEYEVAPIVLASAQLSLKFDWARWTDAIGLDLNYATNRIYKSGGDLGSGSLARELGVDNAWSDALDAALQIAGVKASVRLAHFNHGVVRDRLVTDGTLLAEAPLTFDLTQIELSYDLAPRHGPLLQSLSIGFRYFDYTLPRILYELQNSTPDAENAAYVYSRETPPQAIRTRYYMAALTLGIEHAVSSTFTPYFNFDVAAGYGPTKYYFLLDDAEPDVEENRDHSSSTGAGVTLAAALGVRFRFGKPGSRLRAYVDANYHALALRSLLDSKNDGDTIVNVGTTDVFHGPVAALGVSF